MVLEMHQEMWGVAMSGWRASQVTWLRCVALARGIEITAALDMLLTRLHTELRARHLQQVFYAGDESADTWLAPELERFGYVPDTMVVVYEKHDLYIPSYGTQEIYVRAARLSDLQDLVLLDSRCFESHWTMNETVFSAAILEPSFFVVAQVDTRAVGYAYATSHFGGRLVHLVRIAVDPAQRQKGIGARLLSEVITFARRQQADIVTLNTQSYNEQAQRLYRWFGFAPNGEYQTVLRFDL